MNSTNLTVPCNKHELTEKLLGLTVDQLVKLLLREMEAKNEAYGFILSRGLMNDFRRFGRDDQ